MAQVERLQGPRAGERRGVQRRDEVVAQVELLKLGLRSELVLAQGVKLVVGQVEDFEIFVHVEGSFKMPDLVPACLQMFRSRVQEYRQDVELALGAIGP